MDSSSQGSKGHRGRSSYCDVTTYDQLTQLGLGLNAALEELGIEQKSVFDMDVRKDLISSFNKATATFLAQQGPRLSHVSLSGGKVQDSRYISTESSREATWILLITDTILSYHSPEDNKTTFSSYQHSRSTLPSTTSSSSSSGSSTSGIPPSVVTPVPFFPLKCKLVKIIATTQFSE